MCRLFQRWSWWSVNRKWTSPAVGSRRKGRQDEAAGGQDICTRPLGISKKFWINVSVCSTHQLCFIAYLLDWLNITFKTTFNGWLPQSKKKKMNTYIGSETTAWGFFFRFCKFKSEKLVCDNKLNWVMMSKQQLFKKESSAASRGCMLQRVVQYSLASLCVFSFLSSVFSANVACSLDAVSGVIGWLDRGVKLF